jgi:CelD/BcsL family acetyltransferase involved in cellulose biosynthesis
MKASLLRPGELGASEVATWHKLQASAPDLANPFCSPTFARAVDAVDRRTRVAVVEEDGAIVAFVPMTVRRGGIATGLAARLAGIEAVAPGRPLDLAAVLARCGLAAIEFEHLRAGERSTAAGLRVLAGHAVDVSGGYDAYLERATLEHAHALREAERRRSRLAEHHGAAVFRGGIRDPTALALLVRWKSAQYRRSGWPDPLARGWVVELVELLAATGELDLSGRLSTLSAGDTVIAVDFSLCSDAVLATWFNAYDPAFGRYSPGTLRWYHVIEDAAALGLREVDLGPGDEPYKATLATTRYDVFAGAVERRCLEALARRAWRAPRQAATGYVLAHPRVRAGVRRTLRGDGRLRSRSGASGRR